MLPVTSKVPAAKVLPLDAATVNLFVLTARLPVTPSVELNVEALVNTGEILEPSIAAFALISAFTIVPSTMFAVVMKAGNDGEFTDIAQFVPVYIYCVVPYVYD
jgi:hypothetical protein